MDPFRETLATPLFYDRPMPAVNQSLRDFLKLFQNPELGAMLSLLSGVARRAETDAKA